MKYRKNKIIKNVCHQCGNDEMKIYDLKRYKDVNGEKGVSVFVWCECINCGAVDDLFLEEK